MLKLDNDYTIANFHHFDGVRNNHADYVPQIGDVVNVLEPMNGIDTNGNTYQVKGSSFLNKNVVQIIGYANDMVTINDGTTSSPIVIVHPPDGAFEQANFINAALFKPYSVGTQVAGQVVTGVENAAQGVGSAVNNLGNLTASIGKNISWIVIVAVLVGLYLAYKKFGHAI